MNKNWNANEDVTDEVVDEIVNVIKSNNYSFEQQYVMMSLIDGMAVAILDIHKGKNTVERSTARIPPKWKSKIKDLANKVLKKL